MPISTANNADILQIIEQIYDLWSGGLTQDEYRTFFKQTLEHSWSRRNTTRYVCKVGNEVRSSCKTVLLSLTKKRKIYEILGLGALFTQPGSRGVGLASEIIEFVIALARKQNLAGILLLSDLSPDFYASFGFKPLGNLDFEISPDKYKSTMSPGLDEDLNVSFDIRSIEHRQGESIFNGALGTSKYLCASAGLEEEELRQILRCHNRWAARQPYAIIRELEYFSYQLSKFLYFSKNKRTKWRLTLGRNKTKQIIGYAITECSGTTMRILEIIGNNLSRACLWQSLIEQAVDSNIKAIKGFEALMCDFIPKNELDLAAISCRSLLKTSQIQCAERNWGQPMLLALNEDLDDIVMNKPCPLLELDYF